MQDNLKLIRIFIGSPGGLDEERQAAHDVVKSVNDAHSERWGCLFKLFGWENAIPGFERAQSKINKDLDRCDYFIGVLWNKWGSPPSNDPGGFTSGFEEEYERSKARIKGGHMKDMAIYFKELEVPDGMKPGKDIEKVLNFRQKCIEEKAIFFKSFSSISDFKDVIRQKLEEIGWNETELIPPAFELVSKPKIETSNENSSSGNSKFERLLIEEEAQHFVSELSKRTNSWDETSSQEVARLRLIGTSISRAGNDECYLGNHDANLIFEHYRNSSLTNGEIGALVDCGLAGFDSQNVPLWHWLAKINKKNTPYLRIKLKAFIGTNNEKKNAIEILNLLAEPIPTLDEYFNEEQILSGWFADESNSLVFDAAINFLTNNGQLQDIPKIETTASNCPPYKMDKIEGAIIGILLRYTLSGAFQRLKERDINNLDEQLTNQLFKNAASLSTYDLKGCLSAKPDLVRLNSAEILYSRDEISLEEANELLTDSNHKIRLIAIEVLKKLDKAPDEDTIKSILTVTKNESGFGILGSSRKTTDTGLFETYLANRLSELTKKELLTRIQRAGIFVNLELKVLYNKFGTSLREEIRSNLSDGFKSHFEQKIEENIPKNSEKSEFVARIKMLGPFHCKELSNSAIAALCKIKNSKDLGLIRSIMDKNEIDASETILEYFSKFGRWEDIERIKKLGDHYSNRATFLLTSPTKLPHQKATTIYSLGKSRIADLLDLELDDQIRKQLLLALPKKNISTLNDDIIFRELERDHDECRIIFALRSVQSLPKSRVISILERYVDREEHRYYNSVHWLDLAASLPSKTAKLVAERELRKRF